ncbi:MAG TPA: hypothetical protein VIZ28_13135 [Chitinophagaceae bacterium]
MRFTFCLLLLVSLNSSGQWKDFTISVKGDTLNRVDLKGQKQGPWVIQVPDLRGERGYEEEGYFENGQKEGLWKRYSLQGIKIAEESYRWGKMDGRCRYFTYNGGLLREENWRAMDPSRLYDTVPVYDIKDPSKLVDMVVVKNEGMSMKHGTWNYYDPAEGVIVQTEKYRLNKLVTDDGEIIDDELKPMGLTRAASDTAGKKGLTKPQAILDYEKKNSGKKKTKVRDGSTGGN